MESIEGWTGPAPPGGRGIPGEFLVASQGADENGPSGPILKSREPQPADYHATP